MNWRTPVMANADWAEALPRFAAAMKLPDLSDHVATALAVVIRHERLNAYTIGGTALVLVGLILALLSGRVGRAPAKE